MVGSLGSLGNVDCVGFFFLVSNMQCVVIVSYQISKQTSRPHDLLFLCRRGCINKEGGNGRHTMIVELKLIIGKRRSRGSSSSSSSSNSFPSCPNDEAW